MADHTPGPWHVAKGGLGREIRADDGPFIASVYDHTFTYGERNANAHLIAAAPELLDAARAALAYDAAIHRRGFMGEVSTAGPREHYATGDDLDALYDDWVTKARAAIAKAEER